jgi:hypothetical protein
VRWFKHYSDANTSDGLSRLILDLGFEGYGRYWVLLEFLAFKFDGETTEFTFHPAIIRETLRIRSWNKLETFLERLANVRGMEAQYTRNEIKFNAPILLELKNRDFKTARSEREQSARKIKSKIKNKEKDKDIYIHAKAILDFWNSKNLKQASLLPQVLSEINAGIDHQMRKKRGEIQIRKAISNYANIFHDSNSYYTHAFTIASFINSPNAEKFYSENFNHDEYLMVKKSYKQTAEEKQEEILSVRNPYAN